MKVEKINENKVKIILTLDELEKREISLKELETNSSLARELFFDLIEENNLDEEFKLEDSQLLIEASSDNENLFVVTITKVDIAPSTLKTFANFNKKSNKSIKNNNYKLSSNIYSFTSIDILLEFIDKIKEETLFLGRNSLYKNSENYFLIFTKNAIKDKRFMKTYSFLSEYATNYIEYDMFSTSIKEKCDLIIANNAIQKLSKI